MRLPKGHSVYIEHELYNYPNSIKELAEIEKDIIESSSPVNQVKVTSSNISRPTEEKAIRLYSSKYLLRLFLTTNAIEGALRKGGDNLQKVFEYKYIKDLPWQTAVIDLHISQSTYFKRLKQLNALVALNLGLIEIDPFDTI
jgi:RinA family phage transcriptional activator